MSSNCRLSKIPGAGRGRILGTEASAALLGAGPLGAPTASASPPRAQGCGASLLCAVARWVTGRGTRGREAGTRWL